MSVINALLFLVHTNWVITRANRVESTTHHFTEQVVVGVFDMSRDQNCQTKRKFGKIFESHFRSYVKGLNEQNFSQTNVTAEVVDSCSSPVIGSRGMMDKILNCSYNLQGFIGPGANNQMRSVLDMTSSFNITHTSYGVIETSILQPADPLRYPNFRKVRTAANVVVEHTCRLIKKLKWHYISVAVTSYENHNINICEKYDVDMSVSVFLHGNIMKGVADLTSPYKNLADHLAPLATIMLGEMSLSDVEQFTLTLNATTAQHLRPHIWLVSEQFLVSFVDLYGVLPGFYNHKFICYHSPPKHKAGQGAQAYTASVNTCSSCSLAENVSRALELRKFISLGVDQLVSHHESNLGQSDVVELLYLEPRTGEMVKLARTRHLQDQVTVELNEKALLDSGLGVLGTSICRLECKSGQKVYRRPGEPKSCFHCKDCNLLREVSVGNTSVCETCNNTMQPISNNSYCVLIRHQPHHYKTVTGIMLIVLSATGILSVLVTYCIFTQNKRTPIIKAANRELCHVIFVGLTLTFVSVILMMLPPGTVLCKLQICFLCLGASLTIATILGRAIRIIRIFTATNVTETTLFVSLRHQAVFIATLVFVQSSLAVWASVGMKPGTRSEYDERTMEQPKVYPNCTEPDRILIWIFLLLFLTICLVTSGIAVQARKLPTNYNEATYIYFTVFTMDIIIVSYIAIRFMAYKKESVVPAAFVTLSTAFLVLALLFFNKIYIILFTPDQNRIHSIPESPTIKVKRHRRESNTLVPPLRASSSSSLALEHFGKRKSAHIYTMNGSGISGAKVSPVQRNSNRTRLSQDNGNSENVEFGKKYTIKDRSCSSLI